MLRSVPRALIAALLVVAAGLALHAWLRDKRPNVILITIDTLRADHLTPYGFHDRETPTASALARGGTLFERAFCDVTWTTPSMASTLTGTYAIHHGMRSTYGSLAKSNTTIAEILKRSGYQTGAIIASYPLDSIFGLDQGFDVYDDKFTAPVFYDPDKPIVHVESKLGKTRKEQQEFMAEKGHNDAWRPDDQVTDAAGRLLEKFNGKRRPFFLWVHYFNPHMKPNLSLPSLVNFRHHVDTYPDKVVATDAEVGRLLKMLADLGIEDRTLVILHADHGEALGEHGWIGHGKYLYQDNLHIPLIIRWPGHVPAGKRVEAVAGNVDIAPTIVEAAGLPREKGMDGVSLLALLRGEKPPVDRYAETYMSAQQAFAEKVESPGGGETVVGVRRRGVLRYPWMYIQTEPFPLYESPKVPVPAAMKREVARVELYNLEEDPGELHDLAAGNAVTALTERTALAKRLAAFAREDVHMASRRSGEPSAEHLEKLRSLGYVD